MKNFKTLFSAIAIFCISITFGQEITISGIVSDIYGPLAGANVIVKGTKITTQTDFDGKYSMVASKNQILIFSFISMNDHQEVIKESKIINVKMKLKDNEIIGCTFGWNAENNDDWYGKKKANFYPINKNKTTTFDLENNFKNDVKNKTLKIYLLYDNLQEISESEFNFQNKYKVEFTTFDNKNQEYFEAYNKKAFDYLEDNFNDKWQNEINAEVLSFVEWQNN